MSLSIVFHGLAALAYGLIALALWLPMQLHQRPPRLNPLIRAGLLTAILIHGIGIFISIVIAQGGLYIGWALALSAGLWLGMAIFWFESLYLRLDSLLLILLPTAVIVSLLTVYSPSGVMVHHSFSDWLGVHLLIALVAYGLTGVAAVHAIFITVLDKQLHQPAQALNHQSSFHKALETLPPLLVQENLLFSIIRVAFFALSLTIITGMIVSLRQDNQLLPFDHKTLFTLLSWFIFGALLLGRRVRGWRGHVALRWTLAGFVLLLLAYTGSRFVMDILLERATLG